MASRVSGKLKRRINDIRNVLGGVPVRCDVRVSGDRCLDKTAIGGNKSPSACKSDEEPAHMRILTDRDDREMTACRECAFKLYRLGVTSAPLRPVLERRATELAEELKRERPSRRRQSKKAAPRTSTAQIEAASPTMH